MSRYNPQHSDSWSEHNDDAEYDHVPQPTQDFLNYRQLVLYADMRMDLIEWLSTEEACKGDGCLSERSQSNYANRIDQIYRWVWQNGDMDMELTTDHADAFVKALDDDDFQTRNGNNYSDDSKRKFVNALQKALQWKSNGDSSWTPETEFSESDYSSVDPLSLDERSQLRDAALEHGSMPSYSDLSREERSRKKALLAQRIDKPKSDITVDDWKEQNRTFKYASLIMVTLDTGLRPCEVERARVSWFQPGSDSLKIPKEDSAKNDEEWTVALCSETTAALKRWMEERSSSPKYDNSDKIWLNRNGNPYNSKTLNHLFRQLLREAGIDTENRKLTWYSIRHSVGTHMTEISGLEQASEQLRHCSPETTRRYVHPSTEARRETLNNM